MSRRSRILLYAMFLAVGASLLMQGLAVTCSRHGSFGVGLLLYFVALVLPYTIAVSCLLMPDISPRARMWAVVVSGTQPTVIYRLTDPLLLTGFDEHLHLRTLNDLLLGAPLFSSNPLLPASTHYPGLELLTMLVQRITNLPTMVAITIVVLLSRIILMLAVYQLALFVLGDSRMAALAVMFYAASPQFYFFNSQFAYQTLSLSLAVAGLAVLCRATRTRQHHWPLASVALLCFAGAVITHHLTSWVAVIVLLVWVVVAPRQDRLIIGGVAGGAALIAVGWSIPYFSGIIDYLGPVAESAMQQVGNLFHGEQERAVFSDSAGVRTPTWERGVLLSYSGICTLAAVVAAIVLGRRAYRQRSLMLLVWALLCAVYPLSFATRLAPKAAEIGTRATTFVFVPLALGVAFVFGRWLERRQPGKDHGWRLSPAGMVAVSAVAGLAFLGGNILGSGPDWGHLPGSYMVVADSRSLDPETLAAVSWSKKNIEAGESVMADRVPAMLLASSASLWTNIVPSPGVQPSSLYFSETWGPEQSWIARKKNIRYLYVDSRLADSKSHVRWYFYVGEMPKPTQLTAAKLAKFNTVPGITAVYRHGPVAIYDLQGLQVQSVPQGWTGSWRPHHLRDAALGLPLGLLLGLLLAWRRAAVWGWGARMLAAAGATGFTAAAISVAIIGAAAMCGVNFHPGWALFAGMSAPPLITALYAYRSANPLITALHAYRSGRLRDGLSAVLPTVLRKKATIAAVTVIMIFAVLGISLAIRSAWLTDIVATNRIVSDVAQEARH